jgi:hypothetical protein
LGSGRRIESHSGRGLQCDFADCGVNSQDRSLCSPGVRFCPNWPIREIQAFAISLGFWRARQDSNLRPLAPEALGPRPKGFLVSYLLGLPRFPATLNALFTASARRGSTTT